MVHRPGEPKKASEAVPNSFIVFQTEEGDLEDMVRDIDALIAKEGLTGKFNIVAKSEDMGAVLVNCDEAFARKLGQLPSVDGVEKNVIVRAAGNGSK